MYKKGEEMSKEEAVQLLTAAGYKAKVENSVVIARVENFTKKEFEKVRKILKDAGYNSSSGSRNRKWKKRMSRTKNQPELKVGDTIKCRDADDAIRTSEELLKAGIYTDFLYYKDGKRGLWLEVVKDYENG